ADLSPAGRGGSRAVPSRRPVAPVPPPLPAGERSDRSEATGRVRGLSRPYPASGTQISSFSSRRYSRPPTSAGCAQVGPPTFDRASSRYAFGSGSKSTSDPSSSSISSLPLPVRTSAAWNFPTLGRSHATFPDFPSTHRRVTDGLVTLAFPFT